MYLMPDKTLLNYIIDTFTNFFNMAQKIFAFYLPVEDILTSISSISAPIFPP